MDLQALQQKYPKFIYSGYSWVYADGALKAAFKFSIQPSLRFEPKLSIENVSAAAVKKLGKDGLDNLVFHLGLAEIPSYWKTTASKEIVVGCGYLDAAQIRFWKGLLLNGMGQFFYENGLRPFSPVFKIEASKPRISPAIRKKFSAGFLVPVGGGKDALVTYEAVKAAKKKAAVFVLNANAPLEKLVKEIGAEDIRICRILDRRLFELNKKGFLNGHTPFSSYLAFLSVTAAALFDKKYIAISQERSSSEGNVEYRGQKINHQYSKSFEFEKKFRFYSKKYLAENIEFFSSLRPLYEIQIAKIFCRFPKYFPYFLSCNKPYRMTDVAQATWCRKCPKCLFTYAALYPFCSKEQMVKIFGADLFEDKGLIPLMEELVGEVKPFECVGTRAETAAAFYLSLKKEEGFGVLPPVLDHFKNDILPGYSRIKSQAKTLLSAWDKRNFIPAPLAKVLRSFLLR